MCTDEQLDRIHKALAHTIRREIIKRLIDTPGIMVGQLAENFAISRVGILGHIKVLEAAGLVINGSRKGRRKLFFNPTPLQMLQAHFVEEYSLDEFQPHREPFQNGYSI